eukprot:2534604-Pleurochrysis_carterae.AAC.2
MPSGGGRKFPERPRCFVVRAKSLRAIRKKEVGGRTGIAALLRTAEQDLKSARQELADVRREQDARIERR